MAEFTISIAGHAIGVSGLFDSTRDYCRSYLTEENPEFYVAVSREDLAFEQRELDEEARQEGMKLRTFTDPFLERTAIQRKVAEHLLTRDILLLHGSAVAVDGRGYLFMARCGTGKSTHTRLWRQVFGSRAVMVNDDKPFVELAEDGAILHGAPWSGKHGLETNISVPLAGICILNRGAENRVWRIGPEEALPMLLRQGAQPVQVDRLPVFRDLIVRLAAETPLWTMTCNREPEAAEVSYNAMSEK